MQLDLDIHTQNSDVYDTPMPYPGLCRAAEGPWSLLLQWGLGKTLRSAMPVRAAPHSFSPPLKDKAAQLC